MMRVLDLFAGLGGWSQAFLEAGDQVVTVDRDPRFGSTITADVMQLSPAQLAGPWDVILASPPCETFSVLRIGHGWTKANAPRTLEAAVAVELVAATLALIRELGPRWWIIENPRGKLRRLPVMQAPGIERRTVTYCRLGTPYQKPTDLWGGFPPTLVLLAMCEPGAKCHEAAPNGSARGVQSRELTKWQEWYAADVARHGTSDKLELAALRAKVPRRLGELVRSAILEAPSDARAALPLPSMTYQASMHLEG